MPRTLSIIILHHNTPNKMIKCLQSITKAWLPVKTEIIVVDNGGKNSHEKIALEKFKNLNLKFFDIPNQGYPNGNNFAISKTEAKYYAFVNPDIIVEENTFQELLAFLEKNLKIGIVAPRLIYPDGTIQDNYRVFPRFLDLIIKRINFLRKRFPNRMRRYLMWDKELTISEPVDWVTGAFAVVSQECLEAVNYHDETFFLFMSDVALCRAAWHQGYEVYFVGTAAAAHNDDRLSAGSFTDIFKKRNLRIHIQDAFKYYLKYIFENIPKSAPSVSQIYSKDRLLHTHRTNATSFFSRITGKLQKKNSVVNVYRGLVNGPVKYEQPVIFFGTGVVGVVKNKKGSIGLAKVWRHSPLSFSKKNTFPVFPEVADLGLWSWECVRGGVEKGDQGAQQAMLRELEEEIGLTAQDILKINKCGHIISDTAITVGHHEVFIIIVKNSFKGKKLQKEEMICEFNFFSNREIGKLIKEKKLFCSASQSAILQTIEFENARNEK